MKVVKWQGVKNSDTGKTDGGWLWIRYQDQIVGHQIKNARTKKEAIEIYIKNKAYYQGDYVEVKK